MLWVSGNLERQLLVPLALEEPSNLVELIRGDTREQLGGRLHVTAKDKCLVLQYGEGESKAGDVDILVRKIYSRISLDITEDIRRLVEMRDSIDLITDQVVKSVCAVCVDKTIANPLACSYAARKSVPGLKALAVYILTSPQCR